MLEYSALATLFYYKIMFKNKEKFYQLSIIVVTLIMIVARFLLNEKGRVNPDSIRFMRFAHNLPIIDNTTTPVFYPLSLKAVSFLGPDIFWSSKIVGILCYLFIILFAWRKKFYFRETVLLGAVFAFVSLYAVTLSESLFLAFLFFFLYIVKKTLFDEFSISKGVFWVSLGLLLMYNTRYTGLFYIGATGLFGLLNWRKKHGKIFIISGSIGVAYYILYKLLFIDYFNPNYINEALSIGLHPTTKLLDELWRGLATSFNPFVHITNPAGGKINYAIYVIGLLNIALIVYLFTKRKLDLVDRFLVFSGVFGIICSFFVQYFYSITPLDYRLLAPFTFPIWLVYFKKMFEVFDVKTYAIAALSLMSGFAFTYLSKGDYLENRKAVKHFLTEQNMMNKPIIYYSIPDDNDVDYIQVAEILSTVNSNIDITYKAKDTLKKEVLTKYRVESKMKIIKNKYQ